MRVSLKVNSVNGQRSELQSIWNHYLDLILELKWLDMGVPT